MGTDGWGQLSFYYDYERSEKRPFKPERMRGLVLKSYKFTGVNGIILHAYNGVKYFMGRFDNKNAYFSPVDRNGNIDVSDRTIWARLSAAFDVFFDLEEIEFGYDDGKGVLSHIEEYV